MIAGRAKLGMAVLALTPVVWGAQTPPKREGAPPPQSPMIVQNPDGTSTAQKEPPKSGAEAGKPSKGLVIPKQIVIPFSLERVPNPQSGTPSNRRPAFAGSSRSLTLDRLNACRSFHLDELKACHR